MLGLVSYFNWEFNDFNVRPDSTFSLRQITCGEIQSTMGLNTDYNYDSLLYCSTYISISKGNQVPFEEGERFLTL